MSNSTTISTVCPQLVKWIFIGLQKSHHQPGCSADTGLPWHWRHSGCHLEGVHRNAASPAPSGHPDVQIWCLWSVSSVQEMPKNHTGRGQGYREDGPSSPDPWNESTQPFGCWHDTGHCLGVWKNSSDSTDLDVLFWLPHGHISGWKCRGQSPSFHPCPGTPWKLLIWHQRTNKACISVVI